ncbi:microtubule-associated protein 10 [Chanos chanos]|uniref:Microtubule-associated protein 10 n=1 Tax=Chanos chanos TaxID=29144 RepID=A0A6J2V8P0_CHACN|nr:microtubule-associated protein 10 [Chanos chanos]
MDRRSEPHETLFSFELLVDYVLFDHIRSSNHAEPAVGVRLLDFPTLLIYRKGTENALSKSDFDQKTRTPDDLLQSNGGGVEYSFHKGKSCLFKINLDSLHIHLSNTPLYVMVLDVRDEIPKLMGSSLISLAKLTERIKLDVYKHGICTPAAYGERGVIPLCNLMGERIGTISMGYKIVSLGASLLPHISENRIYQIDSSNIEKKPPITSAADEAEKLNSAKKDIICIQPENTATVSQERQLIKAAVSEAKPDRFVSAYTQTEHSRKIVKKSEFVRTDPDDEQDSTFCPPPLFYCSTEKAKVEKDTVMHKLSSPGIEALKIEDLDVAEDLDSEEESSAVENNDPSKSEKVEVKSKCTPRTQEQPTTPSILGDAVRQLPLLNALLVELSQLNGQTQQQPLSVHPQLAWIYTSSSQPSPVSPARGESRPETVKHPATSPPRMSQSLSPRYRQAGLRIKSAIPSMSPSEGSKKRPHCSKSGAKGKLRYGLTNTFRLRLRQIKPGVSRRHECMANQNDYSVTPAEPEKQRLVRPKQSQKSNSRLSNVDKKIKALINSPQRDASPLERTLKSQNKPHSTDVHISGHNKKKKHHPQNQAASLKSSSGKNWHDELDKETQAHVPSAVSQYSDLSDAEENSGQTSRAQPNLTIPHVLSSSDDEVGTHRRRRLSSLIQKPDSDDAEPEEYQDDFTSLDPTDSCSPDLLSSPEPGTFRKNPMSIDHSSSDSDSFRSDALPVPVKAAASPQRTLKGTHTIQSRPQASVHIVSSGNSESDSRSDSSISSRYHQRRFGTQGSGTNSQKDPQSPMGFESLQRDPTKESTLIRGTSGESFLPANDSVSDLALSSDCLEAEEERDELGSLGFDRKYRHISELVVKKLPGYTL